MAQAGSKAERTPARPPSRARPRPPLIAASSLPEQSGGCLGSDRLVTPAAGEGNSGPTATSSYGAAEGGAPRLGYAGITAHRSRGPLGLEGGLILDVPLISSASAPPAGCGRS